MLRVLLLSAGLGTVVTTQGVPPDARLPVTIEVKQDVEVIGAVPLHGDRGKLYVVSPPDTKTVPLHKGQRFRMTKMLGEGECRIRIEGNDFDLLYCPWLEGFTDHQTDFFKVVEAKKVKPR
jgi:hypothetical protein